MKKEKKNLIDSDATEELEISENEKRRLLNRPQRPQVKPQHPATIKDEEDAENWRWSSANRG